MKTSLKYTKNLQYKGQAIDSAIDMVNPDLMDDYGIVNMSKLAARIKLALEGSSKVDQTYKNNLKTKAFASAHLGRYLLEGEPRAEFSLGDEKTQQK